MDPQEYFEQDSQARKWLADLDNFGMPPPPKHWSNVAAQQHSTGQRFYDENSEIPRRRRYQDFDGSHYGEELVRANRSIGESDRTIFDYDSAVIDPNELLNSEEFRDKVRQFQGSQAHPYASRGRVETTKKIAQEGGTRGGASLLIEADKQKRSSSADKKRITKAQVQQITNDVRKMNRPINPWADKQQPALKNYELPGQTNSHNGSNTSSAYSSYSSVGTGPRDQQYQPISSKGIPLAPPPPGSLTNGTAGVPPPPPPAPPSGVKGKQGAVQNGGGWRSPPSPAPSDGMNGKMNGSGKNELPLSPLTDDPGMRQVFEDFDSDYSKYSRRSRSRTPKQDDAMFYANSAPSADSGPRRIAIPPAPVAQGNWAGQRHAGFDPWGPKSPASSVGGPLSTRSTPAVANYVPFDHEETPTRPETPNTVTYKSTLNPSARSQYSNPVTPSVPSVATRIAPNSNSLTNGGLENAYSNFEQTLRTSLSTDNVINRGTPPITPNHGSNQRHIVVDRIPADEPALPKPLDIRRTSLGPPTSSSFAINNSAAASVKRPNTATGSVPVNGSIATGSGSMPVMVGGMSSGQVRSGYSSQRGMHGANSIATNSPDSSLLSARSQSNSSLPSTGMGNSPDYVSSTTANQRAASRRVATNQSPSINVQSSPLLKTSSPVPWRGSKTPSTGAAEYIDLPPKLRSAPTKRVASFEALEKQQRQYEQLQNEVVQQLERNQPIYGTCYQCRQAVTDPNDATQALGQLYHSSCFSCYSCGRPLKGKQFFEAAGKIYCEEDYHYSGFQQSAERCAVCGHLIMEMILQAVGKSFHPKCFRCFSCKECLDGVPFTVDDAGKAYCVKDYHKLFAPKCAACQQPITPVAVCGLQGTDETVRVVAMNRDYHIDCYVCEGCGLQLTDEPEKRCYPLGDHLLCQRCHVYWKRTGGPQGMEYPVTDV